jgi:hypothetical protein
MPRKILAVGFNLRDEFSFLCFGRVHAMKGTGRGSFSLDLDGRS